MAALAQPLFRVCGIDSAALGALWVVAASGGIVFREPAPYDALLAALMVGFVILGLRVPRGIAPLAVLMTVFIACDMAGSARTTDIATATTHSMVTLYLGLSAIFFACVAAWRPERSVPVVISGTLVAAVIACIAGIIGYLALAPGSELFTLYGRARGTFKDPNVFGPFVILPILFAAARLISGRGLATLVWSGLCALLLAGLLLSFSRGAWAHFAVSAVVFSGLVFTAVPGRALPRRAALFAIAAVIVATAGIAWGLSYDKVAALFDQRAELLQSYDQGVHGRFAGQAKALAVIMAEPLGIGHGEFVRYHPEQPHNVYLNVFLNAGWAGGFAYLALTVLTIGRALTAALRSGPFQPVAIALAATFIGLAFEGLFVDTDHWRHFFMIAGLIWGAAAAGDRTNTGYQT